jgi:DNA ligase-1
LNRFSQLIEALDQTNKTNEKIGTLKEFFSEAPDQDKIWTLALFTHRRPKRQVQTTRLREWVSEAAGIPHWLLEDSYHVVGDLAETISLVLPDQSGNSHQTLTDWMQLLASLEGLDEDGKKRKILTTLIHLTKIEKFVFTKLITGGFRIGVSQNLIIRALAEIHHEDAAAIAYRITGNWDPNHTSYHDLVLHPDHLENESKPYPFYLAYPLEQEIESLGKVSEWEAEWKWDGIRGQLVFRNQKIHTWTRGHELVTDKFPELRSLRHIIPNGTVIDGEIMPLKEDHIMPFSYLQKRIGRKNLAKKILAEVPVGFIAFDLLEWENRDIRKEALGTRRSTLKNLISGIDPKYPICFNREISFSTWSELASIRQRSREKMAEGLMLKKIDSPYDIGRKRGNWWKWKMDPQTIDGVMIYAQKGHGRRADLFSDYTFAVWHEGRLVPFAKAYSGLTDAEMKEVDTLVKRNTLERFGPVRTVRPLLVFEIAFEGLNPSNRHKSGVTLRFPRIKRWRRDKKPEEANTLEELKFLLPK